MKWYKAILLTLILLLLGVFWGYEAWETLIQHWLLFIRWYNSTKVAYYPWCLWVLLGACIFPLMNRFFCKKIELTKTFTHELTHTITGLLLFRRIHSFHAEEQGIGGVWTSGNDSIRFLTALATYCFPIYTFPLMMMRCMVTPSLMPIMDVIIGFTIGLHIVCFREQIGNHQTDINQFPLWFSYIYIFSVWLFDVSLLLMSFFYRRPISSSLSAITRGICGI